MSEIKKHYMRAKRKSLQEEAFSDNLPKITTKRFSSELTNISISTHTNDTQLELSENNALESDLFLHYESDKSNEYLPLSSDSVNSDVYKYFPHDTNTKENNVDEKIQLNLIQ